MRKTTLQQKNSMKNKDFLYKALIGLALVGKDIVVRFIIECDTPLVC
jgi:hypothetical protein